MGGNNDFFENFERNKYLKKLPSMQRVKPTNWYSITTDLRKRLLAGNKVRGVSLHGDLLTKGAAPSRLIHQLRENSIIIIKCLSTTIYIGMLQESFSNEGNFVFVGKHFSEMHINCSRQLFKK